MTVLRAEGIEPVDREELMMVAISKEMADTYLLLKVDKADRIRGFLSSSCLTARLFKRVHCKKKRTPIC